MRRTKKIETRNSTPVSRTPETHPVFENFWRKLFIVMLFKKVAKVEHSCGEKQSLWQSARSLTRNITSHMSMKNLPFHSLLRWKMIVLSNSHYLAIHYFSELKAKHSTQEIASILNSKKCKQERGIFFNKITFHWLPKILRLCTHSRCENSVCLI